MFNFMVCSHYVYIRVTHEGAQMLDNRCLIFDQNMAFPFAGAICCTGGKHGCQLVDNVSYFLVIHEIYNITNSIFIVTNSTEIQSIFIKQL